MTNLNLKIELAKQAIKTQTPAETLEALYTQHKIEPAQHQNPLTKKLFHEYKNDDNSIVKGQKGTYLTLAVYNEVKDKETGKKKEELQFFKGYTVFNYEQTEKGGAKASETKQIETKKETLNTKLLEKWEQQNLFKIA